MAERKGRVEGKVALVTGAASGLGAAAARRLAAEGASVMLTDIAPDAGRAVVDEIEGAGGRAEFSRHDVTSEEDWARVVAATVERFGRLTVLVNNAGVADVSQELMTHDYATWRRTLSVNLDGVFFTFREACKHMVERATAGDKAGGSLVVTSSLSAIDGAARNEAYASTKGAVISMIRAIAVEHARYGVRANAVLPGWIATDMTAGAQGNDKFNDQVIKRVPFRRWGEPEDFGGIAVYLASDASSFHTGDSFLIDGGYAIF